MTMMYRTVVMYGAHRMPAPARCAAAKPLCAYSRAMPGPATDAMVKETRGIDPRHVMNGRTPTAIRESWVAGAGKIAGPARGTVRPASPHGEREASGTTTIEKIRYLRPPARVTEAKPRAPAETGG